MTAILLALFALSAGCVRIDLPKLALSKPQTYATKKTCRIFHEKRSFFPLCFDGGWWIEGVDDSKTGFEMCSSKTAEVSHDKPLITLPVGTLLMESRSEMQYGFSFWYLFTRYESRRLKVLNGEQKGLVVNSDNFWNPKNNAYDEEILEVVLNVPSDVKTHSDSI